MIILNNIGIINKDNKNTFNSSNLHSMKNRMKENEVYFSDQETFRTTFIETEKINSFWSIY